MKQRNAHVDYIRGIAILLVMLGHTVSNNGMNDFADSGMYKVIFALQMPLFMLVSGYVTKYSRPIDSGKALAKKSVLSSSVGCLDSFPRVRFRRLDSRNG